MNVYCCSSPVLYEIDETTGSPIICIFRQLWFVLLLLGHDEKMMLTNVGWSISCVLVTGV